MCIQYRVLQLGCKHEFQHPELLNHCPDHKISGCCKKVPSDLPFQLTGKCIECILKLANASDRIPAAGVIDRTKYERAEVFRQRALPRDPNFRDLDTGEKHVYNPNTPWLFNGQFSREELYWIRQHIENFEEMITCALEDPQMRGPSHSELKMLTQWRNCWVLQIFNLTRKYNPRLYRVDEKGETGLQRRLDHLMTPVAQVDTGDCSVCYQKFDEPRMGQESESPLSFPCGHVVGSDCLKQWVAACDGKIEHLCVLCRSNFGVIWKRPITKNSPWWLKWYHSSLA